MEYKVGDKVRIKRQWVSRCQNPDGKMDKWLGKDMTIKSVVKYETLPFDYRMVEDSDENDGCGWMWDGRDIECLASEAKKTALDNVSVISKYDLIDKMKFIQIDSEEGRQWQDFFIRMVENQKEVYLVNGG